MNGLRYEHKFFISAAGEAMLRTRLEAVIPQDCHTGADGAYRIRSLYFDDFSQNALIEKIAGVEKREKFRIRLYNDNTSFIKLESKQKLGKMTRKLSVRLNAQDATKIAAGDFDFLAESEQPLLRRFYLQSRLRLLRPRVVVEYDRIPFVFRDVRVTFDRHLRSGNFSTDLLNPALPQIPIFPGDRTILEVKYDKALPDVLRRLLSAVNAQPSAISKFQLCCAYQ
ncbi:MAG: polyphosphate polymerase domain-containing protein [Oscillospiraceae bacterium]|jgi:hypothetical protein|nr:polyphosphate polymerase domain-containing protein [Oscillospiraceae bacterium]